MLNYREERPRRLCSKQLRDRMKELNIVTTGYDRNMEAILKEYGFGLPQPVGDEHFGFRVDGYTRLMLNYADALSEELILLRELNKF